MMFVHDTRSDVAPTMISRRGVLAGGLAFVSAGAAGAGAPNGGLSFQVSRNGSPIGTHVLTFSRDGGALTARIEANFHVGFGPITLYRYQHTGVERWQDGNFISLHTETNDNGSRYQVNAERQAAGIAIKATGLADHLAPPDCLPLTHWALQAMSAPLFNPQNGKMLREAARAGGSGTVVLADGKPITAKRYTLAGETQIEDWYDTEGVWAALDAIGKDGSKITYRRT